MEPNGRSCMHMILIHVLILCSSISDGLGQQEVSLSSTLIRGNLAFPGQRVIFTCSVRNGTILEWQSDDYIGRGGDNIQIFSVGSRDNRTSFSNPNSYATRVNVTVENGITEIVSQLFITASEQFPTSSVTCRINGQGRSKTISFNTTNENLPVPKFNSSLHKGVSACPSERHVFKCAASHSHNMEWISDEYIGVHLQITSSSPIGTPLQASGNMDTHAVLESVELENGRYRLTSSLSIMILPSIADQNHTVTCLNVDLGTQQSVIIRIAGPEICEPEITTISVARTGSEIIKGDQDDVASDSPLAAIIGGSFTGSILILVITIVIITVTVCIRNSDRCKVTPIANSKTQKGGDPSSAVVGLSIEKTEEQLCEKEYEAEMDKEIDERSPQVHITVENLNETESSPPDADIKALMTATNTDVDSKIKVDLLETNGQPHERATKTEMEKDEENEGQKGNPQIETEGLEPNVPPEANNMETAADKLDVIAPSANAHAHVDACVLEEYVQIEMENPENSPQLHTEDLTVQENSGQNTITICTSPGGSQSNEKPGPVTTAAAPSQVHGTLNNSDSTGEDPGGQSTTSSPERASVPPTLSRQSSTHVEAEA